MKPELVNKRAPFGYKQTPMKTPCKVIFSLIVSVSLTACLTVEDPQPTSCITVLLGDKDGFGIGLEPGEVFSLQGGTSLPIDFITSSDPRVTDIYPADMATTSMPSKQVELKFNYSAFPQGLSSATLTLFTLGIQDGDSQVYSSDIDYQLYVNELEVPGAFDDVDQFDFMNGQWGEAASLVTIELPEAVLNELKSGQVNVRIEIHQYGSSESSDSFALDYAELILCPGANRIER
jgi:hypothetical protein